MHNLRNPKRVASPSIRGHRYAFIVTAQRWVQLQDNEILIIEGNEDIDIMSSTKSSSFVREIQVKHQCIQFTSKNKLIHDNPTNFLKAWHTYIQNGHAFQGVLHTTATLSERDESEIASWIRGHNYNISQLHDEVVQILCRSAPKDALESIEDISHFHQFMKSIRWLVGTQSLQNARSSLESALDQTVPDLDKHIAADAVLETIFDRASNDHIHKRQLDKDTLWRVLNQTTIDGLSGNTAQPASRQCVLAYVSECDVRACCAIIGSFQLTSQPLSPWCRASDQDLPALLGNRDDYVLYVRIMLSGATNHTLRNATLKQARYAAPLTHIASDDASDETIDTIRKLASQVALRCIRYERGEDKALNPFITRVRWLRLSTGEVLTAQQLLSRKASV